MKKIVILSIFLVGTMLLLPLSVLNKEAAAVSAVIKVPAETVSNPTQSESFILYDTSTKQTLTLSKEDYIFGVVAAEMPALYNEEALKAQAVAAYTFACARKAQNSDKDYDITNDFTVDQSFINENVARERWGENADTYTKKIKDAVSQTDGYMILYDKKPITAVYHAVSSGRTESCADIWGSEIAYLKPVASEGDKLAENYISNLTVSVEELKQKLSTLTEFTEDPTAFFGEYNRTESGAVKSVFLCGKEVSGSKIRAALDLKSSNFTVSYQENVFTFTTYGYGHGVGMSQNGANYMATQGSSFTEILCHYYTGCTVEKF